MSKIILKFLFYFLSAWLLVIHVAAFIQFPFLPPERNNAKLFEIKDILIVFIFISYICWMNANVLIEVIE